MVMEFPPPLTRVQQIADRVLTAAERVAMAGLKHPEYAAWGRELAGMAVVELEGARLHVSASDGFDYTLVTRPDFERREVTREEAITLIAGEPR